MEDMRGKQYDLRFEIFRSQKGEPLPTSSISDLKSQIVNSLTSVLRTDPNIQLDPAVALTAGLARIRCDRPGFAIAD
jgi:hypothetical protein